MRRSLIEANAEEDVAVAVEVAVEEDASHAAKERKQSGLEEEENTKKVDVFFKRYSVKSTDLLLFQLRIRTAYARFERDEIREFTLRYR